TTPSSAAPTTTTERCSSRSIAHFAANRARRSSRARRSPASGSVKSRKSSCARRTTTTGATMRAFGVSRSASPVAPTSSSSTSFDTIGFRYDAASGPITETYALRRGAACNVVTDIDPEGSERVPEQGGAKGAGGGVRPGAAPARPVPDREVARAPRRRCPLVPARPRRLGLSRLRGGRRAAHAHLGGARRAAEGDRHAGHPLRHPLEPLRRRVHGCPLVCDPRARRPASELPLRDRARGGGLHGERACVVPRRRGGAPRHACRRRAAHAGARLAAPPRRPRQVLLEERQVAPRDRAARHRRTGLLGALRLLERRRPLEGAEVRLLRRLTRAGVATPKGGAFRDLPPPQAGDPSAELHSVDSCLRPRK